MKCPICEKISCDHTPEERNQTRTEMTGNINVETLQKEIDNENNERAAWDILSRRGSDGLKEATKLVGKEKAQSLFSEVCANR